MLGLFLLRTWHTSKWRNPAGRYSRLTQSNFSFYIKKNQAVNLLSRLNFTGGRGVGKLFNEIDSGRYVPRALFIDLDPTGMINKNSYRFLSHSEQFLVGKQDAASTYARGYYTMGPTLIHSIMDRIGKMADDCEDLEGFFIFHTTGGGTGSGLGALVTEFLSDAYYKKSKLAVTISPGTQSTTSTVEPYNFVLANNSMSNHIDCTFNLDNKALCDICTRLQIAQTHRNMNWLGAKAVSLLTLPLRFQSTLYSNLNELQSLLIPYPRINYMVSSYAPFSGPHENQLMAISTGVSEMTNMTFQAANTLTKCEPSHGKNMSCCLLYSGNFRLNDVQYAIETMKRKLTIQFVDYATTRMIFDISSSTMLCHNNEKQPVVFALSNTTAIAEVFYRIERKFDLMYQKRAFLHWYAGEGMDPAEFDEARQSLASLEKDFDEIDRNI